MISLFRKIRQKLLEENKIRSYLKYAIGEILLVVIGILIALQVNNWNEERVQEKELQTIYHIIKNDLSSSKNEFIEFIKYYEEKRKPAFDSILYADLTMEEMRADPRFRWVFGGFADLAVNTRGYELLKNLGNNLLLENTLTSEISYFYTHHLKEIAVAQHELGEEFTDNFRAFKQYNWVSEHLLYNKSDKYYEFLAKDPEAINRLATYKGLFDIYTAELDDFNISSKLLIEKIDNELAKQ